MMTRVRNWETRLADYVAGAADVAYRLGKHDCGWFAVGAVEAVTGVDVWPADLAGYSTERGLVRALRRMGWQSLDDAATALLGQPIAPLAAHSGDVVSDGSALGVMTASGPVAFSDGGLVAIERCSLTKSWATGRAHG